MMASSHLWVLFGLVSAAVFNVQKPDEDSPQYLQYKQYIGTHDVDDYFYEVEYVTDNRTISYALRREDDSLVAFFNIPFGNETEDLHLPGNQSEYEWSENPRKVLVPETSSVVSSHASFSSALCSSNDQRMQSALPTGECQFAWESAHLSNENISNYDADSETTQWRSYYWEQSNRNFK